MKIKGNFFQWSVSIALFLGMLSTAEIASAFPVTAPFVDDDRCDQVPNQILKHELGGPAGLFPIDELISWSVTSSDITTCNIPSDGGFGDWIVEITNLSNRAWTDLFFVADSTNVFGNADGTIFGNDAFLIDDVGINDSLSESAGQDGIFSPGERWKFVVADFFLAPPILPTPAPPPSFNSLGIGGASAEVPQVSTASIVARSVPESTSTLSFLALGTIGVGSLLLRKKKQKKSALDL